MQTAARANQQQRELVRLLYIEHGAQKASELSNVRYDLVRQWASRYGWAEPRQTSLSQNVTRQIVDAVHDELSENGKETKLKLSRYAKKQAEHLEHNGTLKDHRAFKDIASGAAGLHGWNDNQKGESFSLNVLNMGALEVRVGKDQAEGDPAISE